MTRPNPQVVMTCMGEAVEEVLPGRKAQYRRPLAQVWANRRAG
jgi:hypothetical protein